MEGGMSITGWNDRVKVGRTIHLRLPKGIFIRVMLSNLYIAKHIRKHWRITGISPSVYQFIDGRFVPVFKYSKKP